MVNVQNTIYIKFKIEQMQWLLVCNSFVVVVYKLFCCGIFVHKELETTMTTGF